MTAPSVWPLLSDDAKLAIAPGVSVDAFLARVGVAFVEPCATYGHGEQDFLLRDCAIRGRKWVVEVTFTHSKMSGARLFVPKEVGEREFGRTAGFEKNELEILALREWVYAVFGQAPPLWIGSHLVTAGYDDISGSTSVGILFDVEFGRGKKYLKRWV